MSVVVAKRLRRVKAMLLDDLTSRTAGPSLGVGRIRQLAASKSVLGACICWAKKGNDVEVLS